MLSTIVTEWSSAAASAKATIATHNVGARLPRQLELIAINNGKIVQYIDQNSNSMLAMHNTNMQQRDIHTTYMQTVSG